ncbi:DUF6387 family protein [Moritella yayanosii]|uniref:Uncharacterized protein n=1 Tax=Moritella yayanosii TaxID=69539 RepID=A0A330LS04_9GAMM|nr:DUF6387 family protein [Moritella yayanosii]SQD79600.1 protein of unknown function [Moritella yayanosii]
MLIRNNNVNRVKIPKGALNKLELWFKDENRGYTILDEMLVFDYLSELEERLSLYNFALLCGGNCTDDRRWKKINCNELREESDENAFISFLDETLAQSEMTLLKKRPRREASESYLCNPSSSNMEIKDISMIKGEYLPFYQVMHELQKNNSQQLEPPAWSEALSEEDIRQYSQAQVTATNQAEYLCPMETDRKQILLSFDIEHATNDSLIKQLASLLPEIREILGIPEPSSTHKPHNKLGTVKKLLSYKAIQYLDLKLYCILNSPLGEEWQLSDDFMMTWLLIDNKNINVDKTSKGAEDFKQYRKDFYMPKLLNQAYLDDLITTTRSDPNNAQLHMNRL